MFRIVLCIMMVVIAPGIKAQQLFDDNWKFIAGGAQGAEKSAFNDSGWRMVDLPHDWSIEDLTGTKSPFSKAAVGQAATGFTTGGTGWYRKVFTLPSSQKGKLSQINFDGVYMNAEVWLNGKRLGKHNYGYTSFSFDLTRNLVYDQPNTIAVKVRNQGENSRWYAGSGIYRHVWLNTYDSTHIDRTGTFFRTTALQGNVATVSVAEKIINASRKPAVVKLVFRLLDASGKERVRKEFPGTVPADSSIVLSGDVQLASAETWSPDQPRLYKTVSEVYKDDKLIDSLHGDFGIRMISINATTGFVFNGKPLKLKGGCIHHDNGPLGARAYDRAEERKIELLKEAGFNAIRTSHNPPSASLLRACDRLGMMVIDEAFDIWRDGKNSDDYHLSFDDSWKEDVSSMVLRDRNHPSVIMWSTGNEIPGREKASVVKVAAMLADHIRSLDPSRPVTCGVNGIEPNKDPFLATLDVAGYNYAPDKYVPDHQRLPDRVMMATESFALDAFEYWMAVKNNSWVIGDFVWTAFDYIGEASLGWRGYASDQEFYPWTLAWCGDLDICGWKRPQSYYRDVLWKKDQVSLFVIPPVPSIEPEPKRLANMRWQWHDEIADWNWAGFEKSNFEVKVYSDAPETELLLNGKSLGRKSNSEAAKFTTVWSVPYEPGELKARAYNKGKAVAERILRTAGQASAIHLSADRKVLTADGQDLSYVTISMVDDQGVMDPKNETLVDVQISGDAVIAGVGNGNPVSTESYQLPQRKAWRGKLLVVIKAGKTPGTVKLTARAKGFADRELEIVMRRN